MAKLITVRDGAGVLQCFGPDNGHYDPHLKPGWTKQTEDDEVAILAEWTAAHPAAPDKRAVALADNRIPEWFKEWIR